MSFDHTCELWLDILRSEETILPVDDPWEEMIISFQTNYTGHFINFWTVSPRDLARIISDATDPVLLQEKT